ncbi:MAG: type II secretion system protein [Candidatus Brocadiia bacterium]
MNRYMGISWRYVPGDDTVPKVKGAFTLIELLVVISIIAVLAAMLMPALDRAREKARQTVCGSNVRQMITSLILYANDWDGRVPFHDSHFCSPWHCDTGDYEPLDPELPDEFDHKTLILPMQDYGWHESLIDCPSTKQQITFDKSGYENYYWWDQDFVYLAGFLESRVTYASSEWLDEQYGEPTVPDVYPFRESGTKVFLADGTNYYSLDSSGNSHTRMNHGGGRDRTLTNAGPQYLRNNLLGANRGLTDGSVHWVKPDEMGRNFEYGVNPADWDKAHYALKFSSSRSWPYYW